MAGYQFNDRSNWQILAGQSLSSEGRMLSEDYGARLDGE